MNTEPTKRVGDYEIVGVLGRGGMGNVFKVRNVLSDRIEAMKILLPDLANGQELADRFRREIKLLASLDHPNIAAFRTALTWDNYLVMIMEYVEGMTLATRVAQGPLPLGDAVDYTQQVLAALAYAHARHVIHRDVKPANVMVTPRQVVKLMDFGIARCANDATMTMTGTTLGSLYYMSPEQVKGEPVDERSDLYSLGITLYELVTGQRPFAADSDYSIMAAQINKLPQPPIQLRTDLPAGLSDIIMKAVAKEPAQRFQSASEFSQALNSLAIARHLATIPRDVVIAPTATHGVFTGATKSIPAVAVTPSAAAGTPTPGQEPIRRTPLAEPERVVDKNVVAAASTTKNRRPYRGLYMSLGALIVVIVLVAAGLYLPHRNVAHSAAPTATSTAPAKPQPVEKNLDTAAVPGASPAGASTVNPTAIDNSTASPQGPGTAPSSPVLSSQKQDNGAPSTTGAVEQAALANPVHPIKTARTVPALSPHQTGAPQEYSVLVETTSTQADAERIAKGLNGELYPAFVTGFLNVISGKIAGFKVQVGAYTNIRDAEKTRKELLNDGFSAPLIIARGGPRDTIWVRPGSNTLQYMDAPPNATSTNTPPANTAPPVSLHKLLLADLTRNLDLLSSRATSINGSLTTLQSAQQAQGLGLRGDIVASQERMRIDLNRAQAAITDGDASEARMYLDQAQKEVENLEKFLGH